MKGKRKLCAFVAMLLSVLTIANTVITPVLASDVTGIESSITATAEDDKTQEVPKIETEETISIPDGDSNDTDDMKSKKGESSNANDSPETTATPPSKSELESYLDEHHLYMDENGKLHYTDSDSEYIAPEVYAKIMSLLGLGNGLSRLARAGSTVQLVTGTSLSVNVSFSDGSSSSVWYAKRVNGAVAFCVEHGSPLSGGANTGYNPLPATTAVELNYALIAYFGYHTQASSVNEYMTQLMIWEAQGVRPTSISGAFSMAQYNAFKSAVNSRIADFHKKPSFNNQTITLNVGESVTLTDTNGIFSLYEQTGNTAGVTISKSGNRVTLTASRTSADSGSVSFGFAIGSDYKGTSIYYQHPNTQDVIVAKVHAQTSASINVKVNKEGYGKIIKKSADTDKVLSGARYKVTNDKDSSVEYLTTGTDGSITSKAYLHGTVLTITEVNAPNHYVLNSKSQTITIEANTTKSVTFTNNLAKGIIRVDKSALRNDKNMPTSSYTLTGNVFHIYNASGTHVDTMTTDKDGKAESKKLDIGKYTIKEVTASNGFIINSKTYEAEIKYDGQNVPLTYADFKAVNTEQLGNATLYKRDKETDTNPQGKSTFAGAVFKLERKEIDGTWKKIGEYTTGADGGITVKDLYLATYRWVELKAPTGYVFDDTAVTFELKYAGQTASSAITPVSTKFNTVIKGEIEGLKVGKPLTGDTTSDEMIALEGVEFTATSQTTKKTYKALTDKNGKFVIKDLPYDDYILTETKGIEGYSLIKPVAFSIIEDKQVVEYILNNRLAEQRIKVEKVDAQTGNVIPIAGVSFKIFDKQEDKYISMRMPNSTKESDIFTTNDEGYFVTSEVLKYGVNRYELEEIKAPTGYVLSDRKITFSVSGNVTTIQEISFSNERAKGTATITKHGDLPSMVNVTDSDYGKLHSVSTDEAFVSDVTYKVYASEDIIGVEGTNFHAKDELVDTIITDKDGKATTKPLEIGNYYMIEVSAPSGLVINTTPIPFEIKYENQNVAISKTSITAINKWQNLQVIVGKQDEQLITYKDGKAITHAVASDDKVFGLFAKEDLTLSNDTIIKADSLLALATTKDGKAVFDKLQLPESEYYIMEVNAGEKHIIDESKYPIVYTTTNDELVTVEIGKDEALLNKLYLTDVSFEKINESATLKEKEGYTYDHDKLGTGAIFELLNTDNEILQSVTIGEDGIGTWTDLTVGTYYQREVSASDDSFVVSKELIKIVVTKNGVSIYDHEDKEITIKDSENGTSFTLKNDLIKGSVSLMKKDAETKKALAGATFKLVNADGKIVFEGKTDKDGLLTVSNLPFGTYEFIEVSAPDGYRLDEKPIKVEVKTDGETATCEKLNEKIPETPDTPKKSDAPKTGDMNNMILPIICALLSLAVAVTLLVKRRKRSLMK
jgi:Predicted outer membrane protein